MNPSSEPDANRNALSGADEVKGLSERERKAVEQQSRASAALIHETIRAEGESELDRGASALLFSGFAAGLSMGFSLVAQGALEAKLPDEPWRELVAKLGYTVGFLLVVLGRQQLFTENTLTPILPLLYHRNHATLANVLRLWGLVLASNIAATWAIAAAATHAGVFGPETQAAFEQISKESVASPFWTTVVKAVFAGWLIALMVWLLPAAESARVWVIIVVTYVVALGSFAHVIAGSVEAAYLVVKGVASFSDYALAFFVPTLLGNVLGGVMLVAVLNYGQVAREVEG